MPENGRNGEKLISGLTLRIAAGTLMLLITLCFAIVGYNFAGDKDAHKAIEEINKCKVDKTTHVRSMDKLELQIAELRKGQHEGFKEMRQDAKEIRQLILDFHRNGDGGGGGG
jgi:hypothetical protein